MLDKVENVTMEVTPDVTIYSTNKNCEQSWTITLLCKVWTHQYPFTYLLWDVRIILNNGIASVGHILLIYTLKLI